MAAAVVFAAIMLVVQADCWVKKALAAYDRRTDALSPPTIEHDDKPAQSLKD